MGTSWDELISADFPGDRLDGEGIIQRATNTNDSISIIDYLCLVGQESERKYHISLIKLSNNYHDNAKTCTSLTLLGFCIHFTKYEGKHFYCSTTNEDVRTDGNASILSNNSDATRASWNGCLRLCGVVSTSSYGVYVYFRISDYAICFYCPLGSSSLSEKATEEFPAAIKL